MTKQKQRNGRGQSYLKITMTIHVLKRHIKEDGTAVKFPGMPNGKKYLSLKFQPNLTKDSERENLSDCISTVILFDVVVFELPLFFNF